MMCRDVELLLAAAQTPTAIPSGQPVQWSCHAEDGWRDFDPQDAALIEREYSQRGPSGSFTTAFSFSSASYHVDFASMVQVNIKTTKPRMIRRGPVGDGTIDRGASEEVS